MAMRELQRSSLSGFRSVSPTSPEIKNLRISSVAQDETPFNIAQKNFYGEEAVQQAQAPRPSLLFSYASPAMLKQARLEALQLKLQERLKNSLPAPEANVYEGLETVEHTTSQGEALEVNTAESGRMRAGGPEQYQGLVVPPQRNATGDERPSTAKVLEKGNAAEYQRSYGRTMGLAKSAEVNVRDCDDNSPGANTDQAKHKSRTRHTTSPGRSHPAAHDTSDDPAPSSSPLRGPKRGTPREKDPRMFTLRQSVATAYVPVVLGKSLVPAKGLGTTGQIMDTVRASLEGAVMRPFLTSAPATAANRNLQSGDQGEEGAGGVSQLVRSSYAGGSDLGQRQSDATGSGAVPLVRVQEEDLMALYKRQSAERLMAQVGLSRAPSFRHSKSGIQRSPSPDKSRLAPTDPHTTPKSPRATPAAAAAAAAAAAKQAVESASQAVVSSLLQAMLPAGSDADGPECIPGFGPPSEPIPPEASQAPTYESVPATGDHAHRAGTSQPATPRSAAATPRDTQTGIVASPRVTSDGQRRVSKQGGPSQPTTPRDVAQQPVNHHAAQPVVQAEVRLHGDTGGVAPSSVARQSSLASHVQVSHVANTGHTVSHSGTAAVSASRPGTPRGGAQAPSTSGHATQAQAAPSGHPASPRPAAAAATPSYPTPVPSLQLPGSNTRPASAAPAGKQGSAQGASNRAPSAPQAPVYGASSQSAGQQFDSLPPPRFPDSPFPYSAHAYGSLYKQGDAFEGRARYPWQAAGPRHRPRPVSAHPHCHASTGSSQGSSVHTSVPARPQSAGRGAFTFSIQGISLHHARSQQCEQGERVSPRPPRPSARVGVVNDANQSICTRKTTSRDRNGVLAWRSSESGLDTDTATQWNATSTPSPSNTQPMALQSPRATDPASASTPASPRPALNTSLRHTTHTIANLQAAALAAARANLQYRVLEHQAACHGLASPRELTDTQRAAGAQDTLRVSPAAAGQLQIRLRPETAPLTQAHTAAAVAAAKHARALSAGPTHGASHEPMRPVSAAPKGPMRLIGADGYQAKPSRPQSALPLNASNVGVRRTRPPSAGYWARPGPTAVSVTQKLDPDECEMLWDGSTDALKDTPGVSIAPVGEYPQSVLAPCI